MPRFDQDKMLRLVSELRKGVARLKEIRDLSREELIADPHKVGSAKYQFISRQSNPGPMIHHWVELRSSFSGRS